MTAADVEQEVGPEAANTRTAGEDNTPLHRPGISDAYLDAHGIRHVGAHQASILVGHKKAGIIIPYRDIDGQSVMHDGKPVYRLRPDCCDNGAPKYLSAAGAGCHLFVPQGQNFNGSCEVVVAESEFKALTLAERGVPSVGLGGFSSGLPGGKMLPALARLLALHKPSTVLFLGDNDTALNFSFSHESIKFAKALPDGCRLRLPRIPVSMPKGVDDVAEHLRYQFPEFWEGIKAAAVAVAPKTDERDLAAKLLKDELEALSKLPEPPMSEIKELASHLDEINQSLIAKAVKQYFNVSTKDFRTAVAEVAKQRKKKFRLERQERRKRECEYRPGQSKRFNDEAVIDAVGAPYQVTETGRVLLNHQYFVARFAEEHLLLHEPKEGEFYIYNPVSGAWVRTTSAWVKKMLAVDFKRFADEHPDIELLHRCTNALLEGFASLLKGRVERAEAFKTDGRVIHLKNGMLHIDGGLELRSFSSEYYSRNVCPLEWDPDAQCPMFLNFLEDGLTHDDINLLQRWAGSLLLGGNPAQRIMILTGTAGGGKTTVMCVFERIIGLENVYELRTAFLGERFEQARFIGKSALTAKDVKGNFLEDDGAWALKKIVGGDNLSAEKKGSNADLSFTGTFGVGITCNTRLRVRLDGDMPAWLRRLAAIHYSKPKPKERVLNLDRILFETEGPGILRWMVQGAVDHLKECDETGDYRMTDEQTARVSELLAESDSLRLFVETRIERSLDRDLATTQIVAAYFNFCAEKSWVPFPSQRVARELGDLMLEIHHAGRSTHIEREGKRVKGFPGVYLVAPPQNDEDR